MPNFILKRENVVPTHHNHFGVILTLEDGYELKAGHIMQMFGPGQETFWSWACPGANGREDTREEAMTAFRSAWAGVTDQMIQDNRRQQESTANKYALWDAGYLDLSGEIRCRCGVTFRPAVHEETMAHIEHIKHLSFD